MGCPLSVNLLESKASWKVETLLYRGFHALRWVIVVLQQNRLVCSLIQVLFERCQSQTTVRVAELEAWISSCSVPRFTVVHLLRSILVLFWTCHHSFYAIPNNSSSCTEKNSKQEYPIDFLWAIPIFCHIFLSHLFQDKAVKYVWAFLIQKQLDHFTHSCHTSLQTVLPRAFLSPCQQKIYLIDKTNV